MLSNTILHQVRVLSIRPKSVIASCTFRSYVSRAHPSASNPFFPIGDALSTVLQGIQERKDLRQQKWENNSVARVSKGIKEEGPYRNQDETVEIALNLNVDPRKPGQAIRGSLSLPHGTGKKVNVLVFTPDDEVDTIQAAKKAGATYAGGSSLIESISRGEMPLDFDRALATPDMMPQLSKIARILGPRGLMPNAKLDTIQPVDKIVDAVKAQAAGMVQYRTDKNGIIHAGVGKGSFTPDQLSDNIREFMTAIQSAKPESFGKGKNKGGKKKSSGGSKDAKYILKAYLTSSQGKGSVSIDLRTLDPTSSYFMGVAPS